MSGSPCPACGCGADSPAHALVVRLRVDDVDGALDDGLLATTGCAQCTADCTAALLAERDGRRAALDARERFLRRERRLALRAARRDARRATVKPNTASLAPSLPVSAAAALQRALSRARGAS